jgi:hypothetical protein
VIDEPGEPAEPRERLPLMDRVHREPGGRGHLLRPTRLRTTGQNP